MTIESANQQINEAILDLQMSDYNTYGRPLARLAQVLASDVLKPITDSLKDGLDFDGFLDGSISNDKNMAGSGGLQWPTNREKELGLVLILIERGANDPRWFLNVAYNFYNGGSRYIESIRNITRSVIIPFGRDFARYTKENRLQLTSFRALPTDLERVFIVHGHDEVPREMVARFISKLGLEPVILHEQPSRGMTIIES